MIDTIRTVETPEGVELTLNCSGVYIRAMAWFIDALIYSIIMLIMALTLPQFGDFGTGVFFILFFLLNWLYPVFFEVFMQGQTPGKRLMKIQVLLLDGSMVNWNASLLRNLLRTVDILPFMYTLGVLSMLLNKDFRRLGDLAANTIVVYQRSLSNKKLISTAKPYPPEVVLTAKEQQYIVNYAERLAEFSPQRAEELALLATPLMMDLNNEADASDKSFADNEKIPAPATDRMLGIANYLLGKV